MVPEKYTYFHFNNELIVNFYAATILPLMARAEDTEMFFGWSAPMNSVHCEMYYARVEVRSGMREP